MIRNLDEIVCFGMHKTFGKSIKQLYSGSQNMSDDDCHLLASHFLFKPVAEPDKVLLQVQLSNQAGFEIHEIKPWHTLLKYNGYPDYIEWCIHAMSDFCLLERDIAILEASPVLNVSRIIVLGVNDNEVTNQEELDYELRVNGGVSGRPEYTTRLHVFDSRIKEMNAKKLKR